MQKPYISKAIVVVFGGVKYRRYPDSRHAHLRNYFWPSQHWRERGVGALHVEIWKAKHGDIPEGHHVHHKDGDSLNNEIGNLECLTPEEHNRIHRRSWTADRMEFVRDHLAEIRPLASRWHGTEEGREWHSRNGKNSWVDREQHVKACELCGAEYKTAFPARTRHCSPKCKAKARRMAGTDDETRKCAHCGAEFTCNRFESTACCSRSCAYRNRGQS